MTTPSPVLPISSRLSAALAGAMVASLLVVSAAVSAASVGGHDRASVVDAGGAVLVGPRRKEY